MRSIFQLEGDLAALEALLAEETSVDENGEVNDQLARWLEESEGAFEAKVEGYCGLMAQLTALADARKAEAQRLAALEQEARNKANRLKTVLREVLLRLNRRRWKPPVTRCACKRPAGPSLWWWMNSAFPTSSWPS